MNGVEVFEAAPPSLNFELVTELVTKTDNWWRLVVTNGDDASC